MPLVLRRALPVLAALLVAGCAGATPVPPPTVAVSVPTPTTVSATRSLSTTGTRRALLVGVGRYAPSLGDRRIPDLNGPPNDVALMQEVLAERGFADIETLLDADATRDGILAAIDGWIGRAEPGDHLVFFFAGHGSQVPSPDGSDGGLFETIVPHDAGLGASDIVDKTLRQRWNRALDAIGESGTLTVVQDNCHSGSGSRDPLAWQSRRADLAETVELPDGDIGPPPNERGALLLSAAQDRQVSVERPIDGTVYGGFTASLARALRATPPGAPADLVFERAMAHVRALGLRQDGVMEGPSGRPLFGEDAVPGGGLAVGVVEVADGLVVLRGGRFMGLNDGATLRRFLTVTEEGAPLPDTTVTLRVVGPDGAVRSLAEVGRGDAASVRVGDLFQVVRPVPMGAPLRVWLPPAVADAAAALAVGAAPCPSGTCSDTPVSAPAAVVLGDGASGTLAAADAGSGVAYRPLPPTSALRATVAEMLADDPTVDVSESPADADYWLVGQDEGGAVRYRWVRRAHATSGDTLLALPAFRTGLAPDQGRSLAVGASRIARIHEWLTVESPSPAPFPVEVLGLVRQSDGLVIRPDASGVLTLPASSGQCTAGRRGTDVWTQDLAGCYRLAVGVTDEDLAAYRALPVTERLDFRYAYLFSVDPVGEACLFFPFNGCRSSGTTSSSVENVLSFADADALTASETTDGQTVHLFPLERAPRFAFYSAPFGRTTLVLLTSNDAIPRPDATFNWPAPDTGLRTDFPEPASWSVHRLTIDVLPGE